MQAVAGVAGKTKLRPRSAVVKSAEAVLIDLSSGLLFVRLPTPYQRIKPAGNSHIPLGNIKASVKM